MLNVKLRYEQSKWDDQDMDHMEGIELEKWSDLEEVEKVRRAEEEASLRQIFDPIHGILDFSRLTTWTRNHVTRTSHIWQH